MFQLTSVLVLSDVIFIFLAQLSHYHQIVSFELCQ